VENPTTESKMSNKETITVSDLNEGQRSAVEAGDAWWKSKEQCFVVDGQPGTGKTSVLGFILKNLRGANPLLTAPTHEAVGQMRDRLPPTALCETTHRGLGLKVDKSYESLTFVPGIRSETLAETNLLVVDESSMLDMLEPEEVKNGLPPKLLDHVLSYYQKVIFLGDWAQLPPVGRKDGESPVFKQGYRTVSLDKVERHGGDILTFVQSIRAEIPKALRRLPPIPSGIEVITTNDYCAIPDLGGDVKQEIAEGRGRILTWTNGRTDKSPVPGVREYNQFIREFKFGTEVARQFPFIESEIVSFKTQSFLLEGDAEKHSRLTLDDLNRFQSFKLKRMATNNTRGQVTRVANYTFLGIPCHRLEIDLLNGGKTIVFCPTKGGEVTYKNMVKKLAQEAAKAVNKKVAYAKMHTFSELFTTVVPCYGQTGQCAQGATMDLVVVDVRNILQARPTEWKTAFKLLNVACSRASKRLILVKSGNRR
jgi:hypothetical protein